MLKKQTSDITILLIFIIGFTISCKDPEPIVSDKGYEAPTPPSEVNNRNIITVEYYSRLNDETLFQHNETEVVVNRISTNAVPALAYLFDRSDAVVGETSPIIEIGWRTKTKSFFVQNALSENYFQGTGMIVRPIINVFDGVAIPDTLFMGGCILSAPLGHPVIVTLMTCRLENKTQLPALVRTLGDGLATNKLLIGTIKQNMNNDMKDYLKYNMKDFRLSFHTVNTDDKTRQIFVLTPVNFVTREITATTIGNLPMYQCKIEYLN